MASSPNFKIYRNGEYVGCCKYLEDAAAMVSVSGGVVKLGHGKVIWSEGDEEFRAGESYDRAAEVMRNRIQIIHQDSYFKAYGKRHSTDKRAA